MKTLYISDMDGTLLNDGGKVSRRSVEIINELIKNGMLFTVATARSAMSAAELLKDIDISVPAVLMNGVFLFDLKNKKAVAYHEIPKDAFFAITEIFVRRNKSPFVFFYGDEGKFTIEYTDFKLPIHRDFYEKRKGKFFGEFKKVSEYEILDDMHPVFISLSDGYDELKPIYDAAQKINGVTCSFYADTYTPYWFLEIYSSKASKANGAQEVMALVGADKIAAFGDNRNDILLFSLADRKYAVKNAVPELRQIADEVIGENNNDGVAEFLKKDFKA